MTESLAIISGKGGSGKTTLALSLAQLLAASGQRVLLVDCDISTHGATYFFEPQLAHKEYISFYDAVYGGRNMLSQSNISERILEVAPNIGFIPSCLDFSSKKSYKTDHEGEYDFFVDKVDQMKYDVIIYDCQAGYSVVTDEITKFATKCLAVIEADAISASSLRVLYSQLSEQLDSGKTYQVFNKISKEEQEVYSKLTHGTLFTNLPPILFDWNVRKAFVTNDLPEINASNPILTTSIYDLGLALFPRCKENLRGFMLKIKKEMLTVLEDELHTVYLKRKRQTTKKLIEFVTPIIAFIVTIASVLITLFFDNCSRRTPLPVSRRGCPSVNSRI